MPSQGGSQQQGPWKPTEPYLKEMLKGAQSAYRSGAGFKYPAFNTVVPFSAQTKRALGGIMGQANRGNPLAGASQDAIMGILGGDTANYYKGLLEQSDNPHFEQAVQNQADLTADDVMRQFSGMGRTGSAANTGALVDQIGRMRTQALAENWNQNIANQRGILGDMMTGQLGAVGAAPGAYEQSFAPYQKMAQVGAAYDDLATRRMQQRIDKWNAAQQNPWQRLQAYSSLIGGPAGQGSQQTQTAAQNPLGGLLGGGLLGAQFGSQTGLGALGGGLLGGGLGLLSQFL